MFGSIVGALIGGGLSYLGAKKQQKAIDNANAMNNQYIEAVMPDIKNNVKTVTSDYNEMRAAGPYKGDYYADPNAMQRMGNEALYRYGVGNAALGRAMMENSQGFVNNQNRIYDQYQGLVNRPDMMSEADLYARNNMSPIVAAAMRDETRRLEENTLPGINTAASGSGNVNSSRAGVASAIAERAYGDRLADVSSDVYNKLRNARLSQANTEFNQGMSALGGASAATNNLGRTFGAANNLVGSSINDQLSAGNNQNTWDQGRIEADRNQYDYETGYNYSLGKDYGSFLAKGSPGQGNYQANMVSPTAAALGGAMSGFGMGNSFGGFGGMGGMMSYPTGGMGNFGGGMGMWT